MEDSGTKYGFSLKNVYNLFKNNSEEHQDSNTFVNELKETSPGVWECEVKIHLNGEDTPKLKSIYKGTHHMNNIDYRSYYGGQNQDSTQGSSFDGDNNYDNTDKNFNHNLPCGKFFPVYGPSGCNFPPDYRLVNSRLGPQYRCFFPSPVQKQFPQYINNQFFRPSGLARWDSINKGNVDNWDPFNLKSKNFNFTTNQVNNHNLGMFPNNSINGFTREVLIYPNNKFTNNFRN